MAVIQSVFDLFEESCRKFGNQNAASYKHKGKFQDITWNALLEKTKTVSAALTDLSVLPHDRVGILAKTRLEWVLADLGILGAGACTVPIYPSSLASDVAFILQDAGVRVLFVDDHEQLQKVRSIRKELHALAHVVCFDANSKEPLEKGEMYFADFIKLAHAGSMQEIKRRSKLFLKEDIATVVYTSGTTGNPKGVMLTHANLLYEAQAIDKVGVLNPQDVQLLFLPLAHIFAKVLEIAWIRVGHVMAFAESIDKAVDNMAEVRPTIMAAVPRIFEKVQAKVVSNALAKGGIKARLARFAFNEIDKAASLESEGKSPYSLSFLLAKQLVISKIAKALSERFGGRMRVFVSGGAPLSKELAYFFKYCNVTICEGYGLTETSAATCLNLPEDIRLGSVGRALPGTEIKIAGDGEILIRGPGVFIGYWNQPEATKEVLGMDGFFHTGDIGELDQDQFLRITDRKKDIIVTAGGKNVAPQKIENILKSRSPLISQVVVHGDKRKFLSALITLDEAALADYAKSRDLAGKYKDWARHPRVRKRIQYVVDAMNKQFASFEQIKKFEILGHDFVVGEELTPSLKVKRGVCNQKYKVIFDAFYNS